MTIKPRVRVQAGVGSRVNTRDTYQNVISRLGIGTNNQNAASSYGLNPITRNRIQLEFMYRGSWLVGQAIDVIPDDMIRSGIDITSTAEPSDIENTMREFGEMRILESMRDAVKWARLYGGAIAVHLVEGQDLETPLDIESVGKDQYKGLVVLDRWMVQPTLADLVTEYGPDIGTPRFYDVVSMSFALSGERIHHSRVIRLEGDPLPYWQKISENGWGLSVIERLYDRLIAFDSTTVGASQLVYKAHLRVINVKDLRDILGAGGELEESLIKMFEMVRLMQTNEGITLIDSEDTFTANSYTFSGLSDILIQFAQQLSGALHIPLVKLFGQSPAGLNATGESDIRMYYDDVDQQRRSKLGRGLTASARMMFQSVTGEPSPSGMTAVFRPLWQMSETEKAEVAERITGAVISAASEGIIDKPTAMKELRQSSAATGVFTNVTDEDIKAAKEEQDALPPPPPEGTIIAPGALDVPDDGRGGEEEKLEDVKDL